MTLNILIILAGWISFTLFIILGSAFIYTFLKEQEWYAAVKGMLVFLPLSVLFFILLITDFSAQPWIILSLLVLSGIFLLLVSLPFNKIRPIRVQGKQEKIDERDALFHRFYRLEPKTPEFEAYYSEHPEKMESDEKIRSLPHFGKPGSKTYHPIASLFQAATFEVIESITRKIEWKATPIKGKPVQAAPEDFSQRIKGFARYLGADLIGTTKLNPAYIYSHIGRSPGKWGQPIELNHRYAIAIAVEMSQNMIRHAPGIPTTTETAFQYLEAAKIAMVLAKYINLLGYEARAHLDGNYRVMCIPIAADAGLGELGRLGLLVTPEFGPRMRISIVTTNLPLIQDKPVAFGVQHFCSFCKKCAINCPTGSVDAGEKKIYAGVEKWQSDQDSCFRFWRKQGTDCAVCIKVCPYSNPNTLTHNMLRWVVRRNNFARRLAYWGDELFYGKRRKSGFQFPEWHNTV